MKRLVLLGLVAGVLLMVAAGAAAAGPVAPRATPVGADFRVSGSGGIYSQVVWNETANQYLAVWQSGGNILGRRVSAVGVAIGADIPIAGPPPGERFSPAVAWNGTANEYLVVWADHRNAATRGWDIFGRRVSAAGVAIGADFLIGGANATGDDYKPAVAWNRTANQYLVVWQDGRSAAARGFDIFGRRVSAAGAPLGADSRYSGANATADEETPAVAWNGTANQYLVTWEDGRIASTRGVDIYGRRVAAAGRAVGAEVRISGPGATADDLMPAIAWNGTANQFLVVWRDERNTASRGFDIYGRRLGAAGAAAGADFRVSGDGAIGDEGEPAVTWNGTANQYLVVYEDSRDMSARGWDVYGRQVSATGAPTGADFRISGNTANTSENTPAVGWNGTDNQYLVIWEDDRNAATRGLDIYGRRVTG